MSYLCNPFGCSGLGQGRAQAHPQKPWLPRSPFAAASSAAPPSMSDLFGEDDASNTGSERRDGGNGKIDTEDSFKTTSEAADGVEEEDERGEDALGTGHEVSESTIEAGLDYKETWDDDEDAGGAPYATSPGAAFDEYALGSPSPSSPSDAGFSSAPGSPEVALAAAAVPLSGSKRPAPVTSAESATSIKRVKTETGSPTSTSTASSSPASSSSSSASSASRGPSGGEFEVTADSIVTLLLMNKRLTVKDLMSLLKVRRVNIKDPGQREKIKSILKEVADVDTKDGGRFLVPKETYQKGRKVGPAAYRK